MIANFQNGAADHIELSEGHVYTNPNYPTLEIGGMPFYLMPAAAAASSPPPPAPGGDSKSSQSTSFYEPGASTSSQRSGGPIYEDIDRMCTYRGSPPSPGKWEGARIQKEERTYCNVPRSAANQPRSDSGGGDSSRDAHNFCGTREAVRWR